MTRPAYTVARLNRLREMGGDHFWISGRRVLLAGLFDRWLPAAGARVLEVGIGAGETLDDLAGRGFAVFGVDVLPAAVAAARAGRSGASVSVGSIEGLDFAAGSFDAVVALDVIEHAADDALAVGELHRVLAPGGRALITVPAGPWLWGVRDLDAGHRRRYTKRGLRNLLENAGFEVELLRSHQFLLYPLLVVSRTLGRQRRAVRNLEDRPPRPINVALSIISRLDGKLTPHLPAPWGGSLVAVCSCR